MSDTMDFALSAEQEMLRESAQRFFLERHPLSRARQALPWSDESQSSLWHDMGRMGWLGLLASEQQGGLQLGMCEAFLVAEAGGRQLLNLPFAASAVLLPLLARVSAGAVEEMSAMVKKVAAGHAALQVTFEGALRIDFDRQCSHQMLLRGLGRDTGEIQWTWLSSDAASCLLPAVATEPLDPTIRSSRMRGTGDCQELSWSTLQIEPDELAFVVGCYRMARIAELLGSASGALDLACDYARTREQFGKPIGSYQAIKHHLANGWMALDNARLAALYAVAALDSRLPDWTFACAAAEVTTIEGALRVARDAVQIHGGLGFTWEHDAHLYLKRIHHVSAMLGGTLSAYDVLERVV